MDLHFRTIFKTQGQVLMIMGIAMLLPLLTALIYGEDASARAFAFVLIPCFIVGTLQFKCIRHSKSNLRLRDGFLIVAVSWLIVPAIGAIPMIIDGSIPSYFDSFFEMCSGFTTTGATILPDVEAMPKSVLMWRAFSHWLGGMGILVFAIALLPSLGISGQEIVEAETPGPVLSKVTAKMSDTARSLYMIYIAFTVTETLLLLLGGMSFFDAITHTFGTVGTGGFGNYNDSIAHFNSPYIDFVITVFMIASGVNFNLYFLFLKDGTLNFFKDSECKLYFLIFGIFSLAITAWLMISGTAGSFLHALRLAAFQVASIMTTTGFATDDFSLWPSFCVMLLFCLFFVGGCSSSTAGGVKVIRVLVMLKMIKRSIALKLHPNALVYIRIDRKILSTDIVQNICAFVFLYVTFFFAVSMLISFDDHDMITNLSATAACLGNIGPGLGDAGPVSNFDFFSNGSKFLLSMTMVAGRLEMFTLLMILTGRFWNPNE